MFSTLLSALAIEKLITCSSTTGWIDIYCGLLIWASPIVLIVALLWMLVNSLIWRNKKESLENTEKVPSISLWEKLTFSKEFSKKIWWLWISGCAIFIAIIISWITVYKNFIGIIFIIGSFWAYFLLKTLFIIAKDYIIQRYFK